MKKQLFICFTIIFILFSVISLQSAPMFKIVDLGTLGGPESAALKINNNGQVIGYAQLTDKGLFHSVLWSNGRMIDLTPLIETDIDRWAKSDKFNPGVLSINEAGMTTGSLLNNDGMLNAFLWNDLGLFAAKELAGDTIGWDLNDEEQVVVTSDVTADNGFIHRKSYLWADGEYTHINPSGSGDTFAMAVNAHGQVTGNALQLWPHPEIQGIFEGGTTAFIWEDGEMRNLGALAGISSHGFDINDIGQVVGFSTALVNGKIMAWHAAFWDGGSIIDLGMQNGMGNESSVALAINNKTQIVGSYVKEWRDKNDGSGTRTAINEGFFWESGIMYKLDDIVDDSEHWDIETPTDINDKGVIVGSGRYTGNGLLWTYRALMLVPVTSADQLSGTE